MFGVGFVRWEGYAPESSAKLIPAWSERWGVVWLAYAVISSASGSCAWEDAMWPRVVRGFALDRGILTAGSDRAAGWRGG